MSGASSAPRVEEVVLERIDAGLGFNIRGGTNNMHVGRDPGIFITTIRPSGAAALDGRLSTGDKILELNGEDLREVPHQKAVNAFHAAGDTITLLVEKGAEQRIRDQMASEKQSSNVEGPPTDEEHVHVQPRSSMGVVFGVAKQWFWVPLVLGGLSALIYYYVRRRPNSRFSKML